ncbi:MAG: nuclease, partial [Myxococcota bacterium]
SAVQGGPGTFTTEFGRDDASPLFGQTVTVQAIVVGDFQDGDADTTRDLEGFFIQEEDADADGDPLTSEGIFVNEGGDFITDVEIGDLVTVTGLATERFGRTVIDATTVTIETAGNPLPTAAEVSLPTANAIEVGEDEFIADLEQFENMLVEFPDALTLTEYFNLDRFNEVVLFAGDEPG